MERRDACIGKYTIGLGQESMSVWDSERETAASMALTVVSRLMESCCVTPDQIGRIAVGTESLTDTSKSVKTTLMRLMPGTASVEGVTHLNACYGGTDALLTTIAWMQSPAWNGRLAIVVATDMAVYAPGPAQATGGAGAVAMLVGPDAPLVLEPRRATYCEDTHDFCKPVGSEFPVVNGKLSQTCYMRCLSACVQDIKADASAYKALLFHAPYCKLVKKAFLASFGDEEEYFVKTHPYLNAARQCGNMYTASLYASLAVLVSKGTLKVGDRIFLYSYGAGLIGSAFVLRCSDAVAPCTSNVACLDNRALISLNDGPSSPPVPGVYFRTAPDVYTVSS